MMRATRLAVLGIAAALALTSAQTALAALLHPPAAPAMPRREVGSPDRITVSTCEMAIKLVTPDDWRCHQEGNCTICRNHSDRSSEYLSRCLNATTVERSQARAGATLSICAGSRARAPGR